MQVETWTSDFKKGFYDPVILLSLWLCDTLAAFIVMENV